MTLPPVDPGEFKSVTFDEWPDGRKSDAPAARHTGTIVGHVNPPGPFDVGQELVLGWPLPDSKKRARCVITDSRWVGEELHLAFEVLEYLPGEIE